MAAFREALWTRARSLETWLCLGLDPDVPRGGDAESVLVAACGAALDATSELVCCVKPQSAKFEEHGAPGWRALERVIALAHAKGLPVLLDAKRGDIGTTAEAYARAAFDVLGADAVTVHPYMGWDAIEPFARYADRGVFVLCRNSNPGAAEIQRFGDGRTALYEHVARLVARWNEKSGNLGLVGGATFADELARVRALAGESMPILVLGVGAQGASPADAMRAANLRGEGAVVSVSRAIQNAGGPEAQREAATRLRDALRTTARVRT